MRAARERYTSSPRAARQPCQAQAVYKGGLTCAPARILLQATSQRCLLYSTMMTLKAFLSAASFTTKLSGMLCQSLGIHPPAARVRHTWSRRITPAVCVEEVLVGSGICSVEVPFLM